MTIKFTFAHVTCAQSFYNHMSQCYTDRFTCIAQIDYSVALVLRESDITEQFVVNTAKGYQSDVQVDITSIVRFSGGN
jgi:hypothetical protein